MKYKINFAPILGIAASFLLILTVLPAWAQDASVVFRGQILLQGSDNNGIVTVTSADGQQLKPNPDGSFELTLSNVTDYSLTISAPGYVNAVAEGVLSQDAAVVDLGRVTLPYGDINSDNLVNIYDLAFIGSRFGNSNFLADIDRNGVVDIVDISMAATNFGLAGPVEIGLDTHLRQLISKAGVTPLNPGNKPHPAKVELGRALYFDKELSGNRDIACATCHLPSRAGGDGLPVSIGTGGVGLGPNRVLAVNRNFIPRNAPEVFNRGAPEWVTMFWDSRIAGTPERSFSSPAKDILPQGLDSILAAQAMFPVTSRDEMRGVIGDSDIFGQPNEMAAFGDTDFTGMWAALMTRLLSNPEYVDLFQTAYPGVPPEALGFEHAANAIAAFEIDGFTFTNSPWDRYLAGDDTALSNEAKKGGTLFYGKANCVACHSGNLLTDQRHHNICAPQLGPGKGEEAPEDFGRGRETNNPVDMFAFRTPPLRNVALTGPWMHAGAYNALEAVVRHHLNPQESLRNYDKSQLRPDLQNTLQRDEEMVTQMLQNIDPLINTLPQLSDEEVTQIVAFLNALTDPTAVDMSYLAPHTVPSGLPIDQ